MEKTIMEVKAEVDALAPLSFRKIEDVKRLAVHFQNIINHPATQCTPKVLRYLVSLDAHHRRTYTQKRDLVETDYIFASETRNNQQRQRYNSLSVQEVSELLQFEFANSEKSQKVHICTECNVEIETSDDIPLLESLQKHFNLEVHQPKKPEPVDVSEPIVLPNLSRRKSAMVERGEAVAPVSTIEHLEQIFKDTVSVKTEKPDRLFLARLEAFLVRHLPDNSEDCMNAAVKFHQSTYNQLCRDMITIDFSTLTSSVAPIIMSIKDNVNQHFPPESKPDAEDNDEKTLKTQKKFRYYGPIQTAIRNLLTSHKLLSLLDDRTGKPSFFCMACEYYTLRFRYDSVLNHIFSELHVHNLATILDADEKIPFALKERTVDAINEMNKCFVLTQGIVDNNQELFCSYCKIHFDHMDEVVMHILDESHLSKASDKLFYTARTKTPDSNVPEDWGPKCPDWAKFLLSAPRTNLAHDTVIVENFIKPSGKVANYCPSCDITLKGPRQILFNHVRQKKHLRNVAPAKLLYLYKNHCRPVEYAASFGNYYTCSLCLDLVLPSFSAIVQHVEGEEHIERIALLIKNALHDTDELTAYMVEENKCQVCDEAFSCKKDAVFHILSSVQHANLVVEHRSKSSNSDIILAYMKGSYILYSGGAVFHCVICKGTFENVRSLLMHLVYAEHFERRPSAEGVFRFYLELKYNIGMIVRNKLSQPSPGSLHCGVCDAELGEENAKRHILSPKHRECMNRAYPAVGDTSDTANTADPVENID